MLTKVEVRTDQGMLLELSLQDSSDGYSVIDIEGLDPVKATIASSKFALLDGAQYQASRREARNIIVSLGLEPDYRYGSVQELRSRLYKFFMPKSRVSLRFYTSEGLTVDISARVESLESKLFTQEPEVSISLLCFDPNFIVVTSVVVSHLTVANATEDVLNYAGSVETGFIFKMLVNRNLAGLVLYNKLPNGELLTFNFSSPLVAGDLLEISTVSGSKGAHLTRASLVSSVLYGVSPESNWINLFPGINKIRVLAEGAPIPFTIEYTTKYGGL